MRKTFIKKGVRELWQHKLQYFFLVLILGLGVASYSSMYNMSDSRWNTFDALYKESRFMDLQIKFEYGVAENQSTVQDILREGNLSTDIAAIEYRLSFEVFVNHTSDDGIRTTRGIVMGNPMFDEVGKPREPEVNRPLFYVDDPSEFSSQTARECYLERKFSRVYDLYSGDSICIIKGQETVDVTILEQVNIPEYFMVVQEGGFIPLERSLGVIVLPMGTAQEIYSGTEGGSGGNEVLVNDIVLRLKDPDDLDTFTEDIESEFETRGIPVKVTKKEEQIARAFMRDDIEGDAEFIALFPVIIFMVSGFGLVMALRRMIQAHRPQIGIFKALGIPENVILLYFAVIGIIIAILGTLLGWLLTIPMNNFFSNVMKEVGDFAINEYSINWQYYIIAGIMSLAICLSCTIIPAWNGLRIRPIDAIQNREGTGSRKRGGWAMRIGASGNMPVPLKLTLRNLLRKPGRSLSTVLGVALSLALFLSFVIMLESILAVLDTSDTVRWDYEVGFEEFTNDTVADDWITEQDDIDSVNMGILIPAYISEGEESNRKEGIIYALEDIGRAYLVEFEEGRRKDGSVVISIYHADKLDVGVGDTIQLELPWFDEETGFTTRKNNLTISGIHGNHIGYYLFMDLATMQGLTNLTGKVNIVYLTTVSDGESSELKNFLITTEGVSSVSHRSDREGQFDQYFDLILQMMYMITFISTALASAITYNLFMINAQEMKREYATMKTLGTPLERLGKLIYLEAGFITIFGIILGVLGGYLLAVWIFITASQLEVINIDVLFSWLGFLAGSAIIVLVVLMVSRLTIRYIDQINIPNVIRERTI